MLNTKKAPFRVPFLINVQGLAPQLLLPVVIDPHGGGTTDGDRHHEEVYHRNGGEEGHQRAEAEAFAAALLQGIAHGDEVDLVHKPPVATISPYTEVASVKTILSAFIME